MTINLTTHAISITRTAPSRLWLLSLVLTLMLLSACSPGATPTATPPAAAPATQPAGTPAPVTTTAKAPRKTLLMHYLAWYETPTVRSRWGMHWAGPGNKHNPDKLNDQGLPDIWSHMNPLIGTYDSTDPDVLECQLLQMKLAGVDGVIVDWYGCTDFADYGTVHQASQRLFDAVAQQRMKFAVCYEDRTLKLMVERNFLTPEQVPQHLRDTFDWLATHWFSKPHYFQYQGRPLLLNFGPIYVKDPAVWDAALASSPIPAPGSTPGSTTGSTPGSTPGSTTSTSRRASFFALHHLWKKAQADGGYTWVHKSDTADDPDDATALSRIAQTYARPSADPSQVIVSAYPGFKDVYAQPHPVIEYRDGKTMRQTLAACMTGPWPVVQLVTWNDYGEGTCIEPTHQFGYQFLQIIQQARREELGPSFTFTADDLTLPARLLELRRAKKQAASELNAIAELLNQGNTTQARAMLDKLR